MEEILRQLMVKSVYGKGDSDSHLMALFGIALSVKPKRILELGVRSGTTTTPLALAATLLRAKMVSVDIKPISFDIKDTMEVDWQFVQSDAITFLKNTKDKYDLVYVDDWHSYDHVKQELELLEGLTTPSGVILLHDLMYGSSQPNYRSEKNTENPEWANGGPYRAVNELNKQGWEFSTLPSCNGLTILRKLV